MPKRAINVRKSKPFKLYGKTVVKKAHKRHIEIKKKPSVVYPKKLEEDNKIKESKRLKETSEKIKILKNKIIRLENEYGDNPEERYDIGNEIEQSNKKLMDLEKEHATIKILSEEFNTEDFNKSDVFEGDLGAYLKYKEGKLKNMTNDEIINDFAHIIGYITKKEYYEAKTYSGRSKIKNFGEFEEQTEKERREIMEEDEGYNYCGRCGAVFQGDMTNCPHCGKPISDLY